MAHALALLALLAAPQDAPGAPAPLVREDRELWSDEIWGYGGIGGPKPEQPIVLPPPIEVDDWLVLPEDAGLSEWQVFTWYVLGPDGPPPRAGEDGWEQREGRVVEHARAACATVRVERDEVRMADLDGAELLFVNGEGFLGDPERRGYRGVPVALRAGENQLLVLGVRGSCSLELWTAPTRVVLATWDVGWPCGWQDPMDEEVVMPVMNASLEPIPSLDYHYGHAVAVGGSHAPRLTDWTCGDGIVPLGLCVKSSWYDDMFFGESVGVWSDGEALVPLCAFAGEDSKATRVLLRGPGRIVGAGTRREADRGTNLRAAPVVLGWRETSAVHAYGTAGRADEVRAIVARSRLDQERLWYASRRAPGAWSDEVLLARIRKTREIVREGSGTWWDSCQVVLYGNDATHTAWATFVDEESPIRVTRGRLETPDGVFERDDLAGWCVLPRADQPGTDLEVLCIADTGPRGARFGQWLATLTTPAAEPDLEWSFWAPGTDGPELVSAGRFER